MIKDSVRNEAVVETIMNEVSNLIRQLQDIGKHLRMSVFSNGNLVQLHDHYVPPVMLEAMGFFGSDLVNELKRLKVEM